MRRVLRLRCLTVLSVCAFLLAGASSAYALDEKVEAALRIAAAITADDTHGYYNYELGDRTGNPDFDCASFVCTVFSRAGFDVDPLNRVSGMREDFLRAGFTEITDIDFSGPRETYIHRLRPGDILLMEDDLHTEIFYGWDAQAEKYMLAGAHLDYDGQPGDSRGNEVNIRTFYAGFGGNTWKSVLRFGAAEPYPYWLDLGLDAPIPGDATLDGKLDASDARAVLRAAVSLEHIVPFSPQFTAMDVDADGVVDASDARSVLRAVVGLETLRYPPAEEPAPDDPAEDLPQETDDPAEDLPQETDGPGEEEVPAEDAEWAETSAQTRR